MGRRPQGEVSLTGAERQARYRLRLVPEATRDTATGEALQAMVDLDLEDIIAIQPPRGFGRD
jgi:hypothetical protein